MSKKIYENIVSESELYDTNEFDKSGIAEFVKDFDESFPHKEIYFRASIGVDTSAPLSDRRKLSKNNFNNGQYRITIEYSENGF